MPLIIMLEFEILTSKSVCWYVAESYSIDPDDSLKSLLGDISVRVGTGMIQLSRP